MENKTKEQVEPLIHALVLKAKIKEEIKAAEKKRLIINNSGDKYKWLESSGIHYYIKGLKTALKYIKDLEAITGLEHTYIADIKMPDAYKKAIEELKERQKK